MSGLPGLTAREAVFQARFVRLTALDAAVRQNPGILEPGTGVPTMPVNVRFGSLLLIGARLPVMACRFVNESLMNPISFDLLLNELMGYH